MYFYNSESIFSQKRRKTTLIVKNPDDLIKINMN